MCLHRNGSQICSVAQLAQCDWSIGAAPALVVATVRLALLVSPRLIKLETNATTTATQ
jgi:hypothetical protein